MPLAHHGSAEFGISSMALVFVLIVSALLYFRGRSRIKRTSAQNIPAWRTTSFLLGLFCLWLGLDSPVAFYTHEVLTFHMIQHLLLMTFAPALILLGSPAMPLVEGAPRIVQARIRRLLQSPMLWRVKRLRSKLVFCWSVAAVTLVTWHIPVVFALAMQSNGWHAVEQASFVVAGLLFWWPVLEPWPSAAVITPRWSMLGYLFLATLPCDVLSGFLVFAERVVYADFLTIPRQFGLTALEDQQCAAALMWTCITFVYLIPATFLTTRLLGPRNSAASETKQSELGFIAVPKN